MASGLLDPRWEIFRVAEIDGVVGWRRTWRCAVALGDPVCAPQERVRLARAFRAFCRGRHWTSAYCAAGPELTDAAVTDGCAAIEIGEELILDPRRDPQAGGKGRELRKKVGHAKRDGATVEEYRPDEHGRDRDLEAALDRAVADWLRSRHGPQIFMADARLFDAREARRWFYARADQRVVGVLAMLRMDARAGYLIEHLLAVPGAPIGTTELLCATSLATLGAEGCAFASLGMAPLAELGVVRNLGPISTALGRGVFAAASRVFHLYARSRYLKKFQVARSEPAFLVCDPAGVSPSVVAGIMRAFNVSLA